MKRKQLSFEAGFHVAITSGHAQVAEMVISPGDSEGGPDNTHRGSDQWLFVVSGVGTAIVNGHDYPLSAGSLMLIERGDRHEIRAEGKSPLRTLNFYSPPAYQDEETRLQRVVLSQREITMRWLPSTRSRARFFDNPRIRGERWLIQVPFSADSAQGMFQTFGKNGHSGAA